MASVDAAGAWITDSAGILAVLAGNAALWFYLERRTQWRLFNFVPPLIFIYLIPAILSNTGAIPLEAPTYDWMQTYVLPLFLVLLLIDVDFRAAIRVMGRGLLVMLAGTLGVVLGAPLAYAAVRSGLSPDAWKGFGALAGSWIGGAGNMVAVGSSLGIDGTPIFSLTIIADHAVYLVWIPLLLSSKKLAPFFQRSTDGGPKELSAMVETAEVVSADKGRIEVHHVLYLLAIGLATTWLAGSLAPLIPEFPPVLSTNAYRIILVTTFGLALSFTGARNIPGSSVLAMALLYLFVARLGAVAHYEGLTDQALPFVLGAYIWIMIHGLFVVVAARLLRVDVHTAAIASAANIGGPATASIVAAYHDERLVPAGILMALIGFAMGNYAAFAAAWLCSVVAG